MAQHDGRDEKCVVKKTIQITSIILIPVGLVFSGDAQPYIVAAFCLSDLFQRCFLTYLMLPQFLPSYNHGKNL